MMLSLKLIVLFTLLELSSCLLNNAKVSLLRKSSIIKHQFSDVAVTASPFASPPKEAATSQSQNYVSNNENESIFNIVAECTASCLLESDKRRDAKAEHSGLVSSSATNWINDQHAFVLQKMIDKMKLKSAEERTGLDRDEASAWIRWMKGSPAPMVVDLSQELRAVANTTLSEDVFDLIEQSRNQFLSRMGAKLILLPSGCSLSSPLREPPASLVYGKLLFGGVTRYRLLNSSNSRRPPRRTGERTVTKVSADDNIPAWIQYGGADRVYESVDMGSAAVLEITLVPSRETLAIDATTNFGDMVVQNCVWKPQDIFDVTFEGKDSDEQSERGDTNFVSGYTPISQAGKNRNDAFQADFKEDVGGLQPQIDAIVRRVLDGRVIRPVGEDDGLIQEDETTTALKAATLEAKELAILGLTPVRGLLLYGPPGTGKTLLARQIAKALRARAPKIVSAPELLDRWVG